MKKHHITIVGTLFCVALFVTFVVIYDRDDANGSVFESVAKTEGASVVQDNAVSAEQQIPSGFVMFHGQLVSEESLMGIQPYHTEQRKAELRKQYYIDRDGADAKITFHVTDSEGRNVSNASVRTGFIVTDIKFTENNGLTDENGFFVTEGKTAYDVNYEIKKEGYYNTSATLYFNQRNGNDVVDGKWTPWNQTMEVTLKEKRNPIPMHVKRMPVNLPRRDEPFGFDFKVGDLVVPHGKGEQADIFLMVSVKERGHLQDYKEGTFYLRRPARRGRNCKCRRFVKCFFQQA